MIDPDSGQARQPNTAAVTVTPASASLTGGQTRQFSATVTGSSLRVTWSLSPAVGTLSASGLYTAPASVFQLTQITVKATSAQSSSVLKTATIYLIPTVQISIGPSTSVSLSDGQQFQFTATVTGTANTAVTWSITPDGLGTIDNTGLYVAPVPITTRQTVTAVAPLAEYWPQCPVVGGG